MNYTNKRYMMNSKYNNIRNNASIFFENYTKNHEDIESQIQEILD